MQKFILLFIALTSWCAPIDKAFFEGENVLVYYQQVEKEINNTINQKLKDPKIIALEQSTLNKLKKLYTRKNEPKSFPSLNLENQNISEKAYLEALWKLGNLSSEIQRLRTKEKEFQEKIFGLKNKIEKATSQTHTNTLLSDQMQYAFYKISKDKLTKSLELYTQLFDKEFEKFKSALPRVKFTKSKYTKRIIKKIEQKIDTLQKKDLLLNIDKDSEALKPGKKQKQIIQDEKKIQRETDQTLTKKINTHLLLALKALQHKDQKSFLETMDLIDTDIKNLSPKNKEKFRTISKLLIRFGEEQTDTTSVAIASTKIGFQNILDTLLHFINKTLFVYEEKAFSIQTILTFSFILFIGLFIAKIYKNFINHFRRNRIKSLSTARLIANSGYYFIILGTFFIALSTIGLDMHTIILVIGAILLWLAFGLQSFISNYAMGILFKIDRSIRIGDHIELDSHTVGDVDDMNFRSVTIRSSDNIRTTIPNSRLISDTFINHTLEGSSRRLHVHFSANKYIAYQDIEKKILNALNQSTLPYLKTHNKKAQVIIVDINRKITRYALLVWVKKETTYDMSIVQSNFLKLIHKTLYPPQNQDKNPTMVHDAKT